MASSAHPTAASAPAPKATPATPIAVIGLGGGALDRRARSLLDGAALVAGGARQLSEHAPATAEQVRLSGDLAPALEAIERASGPVVVLASGDPGFFGIVRALAERFAADRLEVLPGPSSVALAFARVGLPWDDALVVSAHGRDPRPAVATARAHPKVAVLTEPGFGPAELARHLVGTAKRLVVLERLGEAGERLVEGAAEEVAAGSFADPNVVLCLDPARTVGPKRAVAAPRSPTVWALPEAAFEHRAAMVTKAEVRAYALSRLGPGLGDLIWDVGAGSGAVGIECARFGAAVIAVERATEDCERARRNAEAHAVSVEVVHGEAPGALAPLPDPDAVFVGGAGSDLADVLAVCAARARRAVVLALATIERVGPATGTLEAAGYAVESVMLGAARLRELGEGHRLAAENPVFVVSGARR